jgi:hypothetical protein
VSVPLLVPFSRMLAPIIGSLLAASITLPETVICCAKEKLPTTDVNNAIPKVKILSLK